MQIRHEGQRGLYRKTRRKQRATERARPGHVTGLDRLKLEEPDSGHAAVWTLLPDAQLSESRHITTTLKYVISERVSVYLNTG
jgi:hypothetical protein